jgi:hypothetical protein
MGKVKGNLRVEGLGDFPIHLDADSKDFFPVKTIKEILGFVPMNKWIQMQVSVTPFD